MSAPSTTLELPIVSKPAVRQPQPRPRTSQRLRYGLLDGHTYTLQEVGEMFGLTRERIRQIEQEALARLRHPSRSRQLRDYL